MSTQNHVLVVGNDEFMRASIEGTFLMEPQYKVDGRSYSEAKQALLAGERYDLIVVISEEGQTAEFISDVRRNMGPVVRNTPILQIVQKERPDKDTEYDEDNELPTLTHQEKEIALREITRTGRESIRIEDRADYVIENPISKVLVNMANRLIEHGREDDERALD